MHVDDAVDDDGLDASTAPQDTQTGFADGLFQKPAAQMHAETPADVAGLDASDAPHVTQTGVADGSFKWPAAQIHAEATVDPVGLDASTVPQEMHFDVATSPQNPAGHVVCEYVTHAKPKTMVYGKDMSQRHSVNPVFSVLPSDVHAIVSPALRMTLPGGVVP